MAPTPTTGLGSSEGALMRAAWARLGLHGRLAISIGAVFAVVRVEMSHESSVIQREEGREERGPWQRPRAKSRLADHRCPLRLSKRPSCWSAPAVSLASLGTAATWAITVGQARNEPILDSRLIDYALRHLPRSGHIAAYAGIGSYML